MTNSNHQYLNDITLLTARADLNWIRFSLLFWNNFYGYFCMPECSCDLKVSLFSACLNFMILAHKTSKKPILLALCPFWHQILDISNSQQTVAMELVGLKFWGAVRGVSLHCWSVDHHVFHLVSVQQQNTIWRDWAWLFPWKAECILYCLYWLAPFQICFYIHFRYISLQIFKNENIAFEFCEILWFVYFEDACTTFSVYYFFEKQTL